MDIITFDVIVEGKEYKVRPGLKYEIAKGIVATMRPDTFDLVEAFEKVPVTEDGSDGGKARPLHAVAMDKAKVILETPANWDAWGSASPKVVWRAVQDFLRLTMPGTVPEN